MKYDLAKELELESGDKINIYLNPAFQKDSSKSLQGELISLDSQGISYELRGKRDFRQWSRIQNIEKIVKTPSLGEN
jgi:hypothetical protein